jgi:uncharacterized protein DUF5818
MEMKIIVICSALLLWMVAFSDAGDEPMRTFRGEIADNQCAQNIHSLTHSHQEMLKSKSMGGTSSSCATYCIKYLGGDLVLASKKDVYRLDDQEKAAKFMGEKVKVTGVLQPKKDTIHVISIELDGRPSPSEPSN